LSQRRRGECRGNQQREKSRSCHA